MLLKFRIGAPRPKESWLSFALISPMLVLSVQYVVLIAFDLIATDLGVQIQLISKIIVALIYLSTVAVFSESLKHFAIAYFCLLLIVLLNYLLYPSNWEMLNSVLFTLFLVNIPTLVFAYNLKDYSIFYSVLEKTSKFIMLLGMIIAILVLLEVSEIGIYSMSLSYYLLLPALLYLDKLFSKFEISIFLLFVLTLLIIIIFGSRGPLVALLSFFIIRIIRIDRSNKVSQIVYHSLIVLFSLILAINFRSILIKFNEFLNDFGIRSRTVTLFLSDALNTSGRDVIYRVALDRIAAQPFFGYGLTGDRVFIDRLYYAHNIFLEITLNFGLLIGIPIVMFVLYIILVSIFSYTDLRSNTVLIWFALSFVPLMFSGSWILDTNFWILLGFCLSSFLTLRRKILLD